MVEVRITSVDIAGQQQQSADEPAGAPSSTGADERPIVVLSGNNCWNILNFRAPLLTGLQQAGYRLVAFATIDGYAEELRSRGIEILEVPIARSGMNPVTDARLVFRYYRMLRELRPAAYCGFTSSTGMLSLASCGLTVAASPTTT